MTKRDKKGRIFVHPYFEIFKKGGPTVDPLDQAIYLLDAMDASRWENAVVKIDEEWGHRIEAAWPIEVEGNAHLIGLYWSVLACVEQEALLQFLYHDTLIQVIKPRVMIRIFVSGHHTLPGHEPLDGYVLNVDDEGDFFTFCIKVGEEEIILLSQLKGIRFLWRNEFRVRLLDAHRAHSKVRIFFPFGKHSVFSGGWYEGTIAVIKWEEQKFFFVDADNSSNAAWIDPFHFRELQRL